MDARGGLTRWEDLPLETVTEMVARKTVSGDELTLTQIYVKKGALVPRHAHDVEQFIYVLRGALQADVAGTTHVVHEGEILRVAAGVAHQAEALDDTFVFDIRRL